MTLNAVVLPAPFGPISPAISSSSTASESSSNARIPPKRRLTLSTSSSATRRLASHAAVVLAEVLGEGDHVAAAEDDAVLATRFDEAAGELLLVQLGVEA